MQATECVMTIEDSPITIVCVLQSERLHFKEYLFVSHSSYGLTINGRLLTDCTYYTCRFKIASDKTHA